MLNCRNDIDTCHLAIYNNKKDGISGMEDIKLNKDENFFMGTKEASKLWGVPQSTITRWCREKKIKGVEHDDVGSPWRIPKNAVPPKRK
jgi:helix-turn-helix, psq domain